MTARQAVTNRRKGQVEDSDAVGLSLSQIAAAFDAEQGSRKLQRAMWAAFYRVAKQYGITADDARILLMGGFAI